MVYPALEKVKQKTLQPDATSLHPKMKSRREEGRGGRAGFRARVVAKPTPGELPISLPLATITLPAVWSGGEKGRATKGKRRRHRVAHQKFAGIGQLGWNVTGLWRVTHNTKFRNMYNSRSKNGLCLRVGNVFPSPCLQDK